MTAITARFDGEKFVLPDDIRLDGAGDAIITLSDAVRVLPSSEPRKQTLREFMNGSHPSGRTMAEVEGQLRELDEEWEDPRARLLGEPK